MKNPQSFFVKIIFFMLISVVFGKGYSQTEKQVQEIIKDYDMVKANQLLQNVKQRELLQRKEVQAFAKANKLPIYKENPKGGFDQLMRISPEGIPLYYSIDNVEAAISTRVPHLRTGGSLGINLTGLGMVPRMWDGGPIHDHREYSGKINMVDNTVRDVNSFHAIHVMGTIIGTGVTPAAKGMAPDATSRSFDWNEDESEAISEAMNGMLLSNHSYGTPVGSSSAVPPNLMPAWYMGSYVADSYNWDVIAYTFPNYLPIMSAGNDGTNNGNTTPTTTGYDKLNGNKNAKNILTIANAQDASFNATAPFALISGGTVHSSSSQGPSDDKRIKPDVTGDGAGTGSGIYSAGNGSGTGGNIMQYSTLLGTSMAAPNVTGTLTLIQQHANNVNGKFMRASTLKGLVCHTATDRGNVGPDANHGWGLVDARFAAETITNNGLTSWISEESLAQGQSVVKQFVATGGTTPLLSSICWTDVPDISKVNTTSTVNDTTPDLTNDLDIRVTQGASIFYPWRLTNVATNPATRSGDNPVDNVERVNIDAPTASSVYTVTITHKGTLADGPQKFALVVTGVASNFTFKTLTDTQTKCSNSGNAVYPFSLTKIGGANITMSSANVPVGATLAFSANNFSTNATFDITISNLASVAAGSYTIDIIGNNGTETEIRKLFLTVYHPTFSSPIYSSPADGLTGVTTAKKLIWQNDINATSWDVQVSTSPIFSTIAFSGNVTTPSFDLSGLASQTIYYWRVRPLNSCATGSYISKQSFQTAIVDCAPAAFNGAAGVVTIPTTAGATASKTINVTGGLTIGKISATVNITHTYVQDMTITLTGPTSIGSPVVVLQKEACGGQPDINCTYDDAGVAPTCSATTPAISGSIKSFESLTAFDGLLADGVWTLTVNDPYNGDGGTLNSVSLKICAKTNITPVPVLTTNALNVVATSTSVITSADINATSTAQTDLQQTYTLVQAPVLGNLKKNGTNLIAGNTFTQKDINDGIITYVNTEVTSTTTSFKIEVKNISNGWVGGRQVSVNVVACGSISTTWNGTAWSNGIPSKTTAVVFTGNYSSIGNIEACSVVVNTGSNVTINSGHTFITNGSVTTNGSGVFTVNNNAALRQIDPSVVNVGNIIVKRNSASMVRLDYTAWSSPVVGQQLQAFSPNTLAGRFYQYLFTGTTTATSYQSVTATNNFITGKGYMIRAANDWPLTPTIFNGQFKGVPTNGNVSQSIGIGYNLLGNPYASPIDARVFLTSNPSIGTVYFWTHSVAAIGSAYPQNNYASYTTLGGTASAAGGAVPNGTIQTGQGFFINASAAGTANFFNTQRVNASVSTQFFKSSNEISSNEQTEKHRIWLNLNDSTNSYNQILVGYTDNATSGFDNTIDGKVFDTSNTMLYSIINDSEFVIQGKGLPFTDTDEVPLGLKATTAGNYVISLENVDGLFAVQNIFLKDKVANSIHDIKLAPYSFSTTEGVFNNRFAIVYQNSALSNETFVSNESITVFTKDDKIQINATSEIAAVQVYDILGRSIYNYKNYNEKSVIISNLTSKNQTLIVKVVLKNGETFIKKIIV